jgi:hypothetical protein
LRGTRRVNQFTFAACQFAAAVLFGSRSLEFQQLLQFEA